jgi:hypothetical protein
MFRLLLTLGLLTASAPNSGVAADSATTNDDEVLPLGEDDMPLGEDDMPAGDDNLPAGDDDAIEAPLPAGEDGPAVTPPRRGPALVGLKARTEAACSERAQVRGYLVVNNEKAREIDLAGHTAQATLSEGPGACVAQFEIDLSLNATCTIAMRFADDGAGSFYTSSVRFNVENCPDLKSTDEARYVLSEGALRLTWSGERDKRCLREGQLTIDGTISLRGGGNSITVRAEELSLRGDLPLVRDARLQCFKRRVTAVHLAVERGARPNRWFWPTIIGGSTAVVAGGAAAYFLIFAPTPTGALVIDLH